MKQSIHRSIVQLNAQMRHDLLDVEVANVAVITFLNYTAKNGHTNIGTNINTNKRNSCFKTVHQSGRETFGCVRLLSDTQTNEPTQGRDCDES